MLEKHVHAATTRRRLRSGLAANHVDNFAEWLHARDYKTRTVFRLLQSLAAWTDWLAVTGRSSSDFVSGYRDCSRYVQSTPHVLYSRGPNQDTLRAVRLFLNFLIERGALSENQLEAGSDRFPILREFRAWMLEHRGVMTTTLDVYKPVLEELLDSLGEVPSEYGAENLRKFVSRRGARHGSSYAQLTGTAVRSFMRFLGATGQSPSGLEHAIPPYAGWRQASVPRYLPKEDIRKVIAACPRTSIGLRDKSILLLLARLGLRAGDIVRLRLSDIDWSGGQISVSGKGRRQDLLPMPQEIGACVLRYIGKGRPQSNVPELFLTCAAPFRRLSVQAVTGLVRRALERAGVDSPVRGAYLLRHSAATSMLRQGVSLPSIGAVLRHRSPRTTIHYAKVDLRSLSAIAQPWPEVAQC